MIKRGRYTSILGLISFILIINSTGCQPAPALTTPLVSAATPTQLVATTTATPRPTLTPPNTPTRTPALTKSPTSPQVFFPATVSTPNGPATNYGLRPWTEVDSDELVAAVLRMQDDYQGNRVNFAKWFFCAERLLRYPDSPYWSTWA